jgi:hypothetical protein
MPRKLNTQITRSSGVGRLLEPHRVLFALFAAMTERENIHEATLEGLNAAARKGNHGGRPPVITEDMLHTLLRRRAHGESVEDIRPDLIIPTGKRKGRNPEPCQHLPSASRTRQTPALPRSPRPGPSRLHHPSARHPIGTSTDCVASSLTSTYAYLHDTAAGFWRIPIPPPDGVLPPRSSIRRQASMLMIAPFDASLWGS